MNNKYKAVFFDMDGTLLDTAKDLIPEIQMCAKNFGFNPAPEKKILEFVGISSRSMLSAATGLPLEHPTIDKMIKYFHSRYEKVAGINAKLFEGLGEILEELERNKIPWGIVTNKKEVFAQITAQRQNLAHRTIAIIGGDTLGVSKPDARVLKYACAMANVLTSEAIFLGDSETDIKAAQNSGLKSIACLWGYIPKTDNPKLWKADFYAQKPNELREILFS